MHRPEVSHIRYPSGTVYRNPAPALFYIGMALTVLNLAFLGWTAVFPAARAGDNSTEPDAAGTDKMLRYIRGKDADPACGACLAAGKKYLKEKRMEAVRAMTADMARIPGGEYRVGSPEGTGDPDEHPAHVVRLDAYYLDKYEVNASSYLKFTAETGGNHPEWLRPGGKFNIETGQEDYYKRLSDRLKDGSYPVIGVGWRDAEAYCRWAGKRLPTEAEWETAARGGTETLYHFGNDERSAGEYAWTETNSGGVPHPVGSKKANGLGVHDMHGNVWEWVQDFYDAEYYQRSPRRSPQGPETGKERIIRGGSWAFDADSSRSANRASYSKANDDIGFRCAVSENELERQNGDRP